MNWKFIFCTFTFSFVSVWSDSDTIFKYDFCVPRSFKENLERLNTSLVKDGGIVNYFVGRDIFECMDRVAAGTSNSLISASVVPVWIAQNTPKYQNLRIYTEIFPNESHGMYRLDVEALIKKDLTINSLEDLRGLKACFSDNKLHVPYGHFKKQGVFKEKYNPALMAKEILYRDFAEFFGESCIPNDWSHISEVDKRLKKTYPSLVALCNNTEDEKEQMSGEMECLNENNAQIIWISSNAVRVYFEHQLSEEENDTEIDKYMFLCPDGTKKTVRDKNPCYWQGFPFVVALTDPKNIVSMENLQSKTKQIFDILMNGAMSEEDAKKAFNFVSKVVTPSEIIQRSNITDMMIGEEVDGYKLRTIDFCVRSDVEMALCKVFSVTAKLMNFRPVFNCILKTDVSECMNYVKQKGGITYIDPYLINVAKNEYNLVPSIAENYRLEYDYQNVIGVVKKQSSYKSWEDLRGARICSSGFKSIGEYIAPFNALKQKELISKNANLGSKEFAEFFSGGYCAPEDSHITEHFNQTGCSRSPGQYKNIFECLTEQNDTIAFVKEIHLEFNDRIKRSEKWGEGISEEDFELFCLDGTRALLNETNECSLLKEPPYMFVTKSDQPKLIMDEIQTALADSVLQIRHFLRVYFDSIKYPNIIIQSAAISLGSTEKYNGIVEEYNKILEELNPSTDI